MDTIVKREAYGKSRKIPKHRKRHAVGIVTLSLLAAPFLTLADTAWQINSVNTNGLAGTVFVLKSDSLRAACEVIVFDHASDTVPDEIILVASNSEWWCHLLVTHASIKNAMGTKSNGVNWARGALDAKYERLLADHSRQRVLDVYVRRDEVLCATFIRAPDGIRILHSDYIGKDAPRERVLNVSMVNSSGVFLGQKHFPGWSFDAAGVYAETSDVPAWITEKTSDGKWRTKGAPKSD